jgi:hypothetical protein
MFMPFVATPVSHIRPNLINTGMFARIVSGKAVFGKTGLCEFSTQTTTTFTLATG